MIDWRRSQIPRFSRYNLNDFSENRPNLPEVARRSESFERPLQRIIQLDVVMIDGRNRGTGSLRKGLQQE